MNEFFSNGSTSDVHAVILLNYLRRHQVLVFKELAERVKKLTILLSTPMEPNRHWEPEWEGLDVRVQKNWTVTARWKHSSGYEAPNFIHIPIDTNSQLKRIKPDIVFSYEFGMRTLFCSWYQRWHREVPVVMVGNMSEYVEQERGKMRQWLRKYLTNRLNYFTYNGPSCKRYLMSLGVSEEQLYFLPYCFDYEKAFAGQKEFSNDGTTRLVFSGFVSGLKGILEFTRALKTWSNHHPDRRIEFTICGEGPLVEKVAECQTPQLKINFLGNCDSQELRSAYQEADICVFPTLADEWGLVPVEAMASGVPVLGSRLAQSVEVLCKEGVNGWLFWPMEPNDMAAAIDRALQTDRSELERMSLHARRAVEPITPERSADQFVHIIESLTNSGHQRSVATPQNENVRSAQS